MRATTTSRTPLGGRGVLRPAAPLPRLGRLRVTVLAGGPGAEREVSLESGRLVAEALRARGHNVALADIAPDHLEALDREADVVFIALHGTFGEDGQLQRILEQRGIRFCGSGAQASALAIDKVATKQVMARIGIRTPAYVHVRAGTDGPIRFHLPAVVKPVREGSSVGCQIVRHASQLVGAVDACVRRYGEALVEQRIVGREVTVGILGEQALPVCEIRTTRGFYDYQAKYHDDTTEYLFDVDLPGPLLARLQEESLRLHRALGCRDFSRVDWIVEGSTGEPYCLEINTIPGLTSHSLLPKAAARAGIDYPTLCERLLEMAMRRAAR